MNSDDEIIDLDDDDLDQVMAELESGGEPAKHPSASPSSLSSTTNKKRSKKKKKDHHKKRQKQHDDEDEEEEEEEEVEEKEKEEEKQPREKKKKSRSNNSSGGKKKRKASDLVLPNIPIQYTAKELKDKARRDELKLSVEKAPSRAIPNIRHIFRERNPELDEHFHEAQLIVRGREALNKQHDPDIDRQLDIYEANIREFDEVYIEQLRSEYVSTKVDFDKCKHDTKNRKMEWDKDNAEYSYLQNYFRQRQRQHTSNLRKEAEKQLLQQSILKTMGTTTTTTTTTAASVGNQELIVHPDTAMNGKANTYVIAREMLTTSQRIQESHNVSTQEHINVMQEVHHESIRKFQVMRQKELSAINQEIQLLAQKLMPYHA